MWWLTFSVIWSTIIMVKCGGVQADLVLEKELSENSTFLFEDNRMWSMSLGVA